MTDGRLVIAGKLVLDEVLTCAAPVAPGSAQRATSRTIIGGGQVWHTARAAARAGARVTVTGWCGAGADSVGLRSALHAAEVDDRMVADGAASRAVVLVGPDGERTIVSTGGTGALSPSALSLPADTGWLHLDGFALDERSGDALLSLTAVARARGVPISVEPASLASLPARTSWLGALPPLAAVLGRPDELAATLPLLAQPPLVQVAHDGPRPVVTTSADGTVTTPVPASSSVATTGAGDRFAGGWLTARMSGDSLDAAAEAGVAAAHEAG